MKRTHTQIQRIAQSLVHQVMYNLSGRKGFDILLDELDEAVARKVMSDLTKIVARELEAMNI